MREILLWLGMRVRRLAHTSYSLVGLEKVQGKYIYRKPNKNIFNTTRLGLLKAKKNYTAHPDGYKSDKIISHTGSAKKQNIPYNPIELE